MAELIPNSIVELFADEITRAVLRRRRLVAEAEVGGSKVEYPVDRYDHSGWVAFADGDYRPFKPSDDWDTRWVAASTAWQAYCRWAELVNCLKPWLLIDDGNFRVGLNPQNWQRRLPIFGWFQPDAFPRLRWVRRPIFCNTKATPCVVWTRELMRAFSMAECEQLTAHLESEHVWQDLKVAVDKAPAANLEKGLPWNGVTTLVNSI